jgi:hypothetical protein
VARNSVEQACLVLVCLLASVAPAAAECAWVLWSESIAPSQPAELFEAHPTIDDCVQGLGSIVATMRAKQEGERRGYLRCLPDTVDPRGTKKSPQ